MWKKIVKAGFTVAEIGAAIAPWGKEVYDYIMMKDYEKAADKFVVETSGYSILDKKWYPNLLIKYVSPLIGLEVAKKSVPKIGSYISKLVDKIIKTAIGVFD